MATATLSRGATSVTFNLWEEAGNLQIALDSGKPNAEVKEVALEDPRVADHSSALEQITVVGRLDGASAYADATTMAEDLVKPHSGGTALTLDLSAITGLLSYEVGVPSARALELDYRPGVKNVVDLQLSVPVVDTTVG